MLSALTADFGSVEPLSSVNAMTAVKRCFDLNKTRACRRLHIRYAVGKFAHACGKSWPDHPRRRTSARVVLRSARRGAKLSPEEAVPLTDARQGDEPRPQPRFPAATNNASNTR